MNRTVGLQTKIAVCAISFILFLFAVYFWRSFRADANDFADMVNKGNAYMEAECYKEAIECYQQALEKEPGNERIVLAIINAYMSLGEKQGESDEAIISYLTALAIRPDNRTAYWALSDIYESRGDISAQIDILQKGFADTGDSTMKKQIARIRNEKSIAKNQNAYEQMDEKERALHQERASNMLSPLLEYFKNQDYDTLKKMLNEQNYITFADEIIGNNFYYIGDLDSYNNREGIGLAAYENGYYYYGEYVNNQRSGHGVWFRATFADSSSIDTYLFEGQWTSDMPNGDGVATTNYKAKMLNANDFVTEVVEGNYTNGLENGTMTFTGTTKGKATQIFEYSIYDGVPERIEDDENGRFVFAKTKNGNASLTSDGSIRGVSGFDRDDSYDGDYFEDEYEPVSGGNTVFRREADDEFYDDDYAEEFVEDDYEDTDASEEGYAEDDSVSSGDSFENNDGAYSNASSTFSNDESTEIFGE